MPQMQVAPRQAGLRGARFPAGAGLQACGGGGGGGGRGPGCAGPRGVGAGGSLDCKMQGALVGVTGLSGASRDSNLVCGTESQALARALPQILPRHVKRWAPRAGTHCPEPMPSATRTWQVGAGKGVELFRTMRGLVDNRLLGVFCTVPPPTLHWVVRLSAHLARHGAALCTSQTIAAWHMLPDSHAARHSAAHLPKRALPRRLPTPHPPQASARRSTSSA